MAWIVTARQIVGPNGEASGRYKMTALSDEDGGGPYGDPSHDHPNAEEAQVCDRCDDYISRITGFPSRKQRAVSEEERERVEYERLKAKYG